MLAGPQMNWLEQREKLFQKAEHLDPCWEAVRSKARQVKFNADPHGFIVLNKSDKPGECYHVEDYSFNKKFQGTPLCMPAIFSFLPPSLIVKWAVVVHND